MSARRASGPEAQPGPDGNARVGDAGHAGPSHERERLDDEPAVVVPITGELDLHAFAPRDIPAVVEDYVEACRTEGVRELRLIHGRGRGVQRAVVRRVLRGLPGVVDVRDAPPDWGGWGATLARLENDVQRVSRENPGNLK